MRMARRDTSGANRCMYVLNSDLFGYVWYESVDGKPFTMYSVTQMTRENAVQGGGDEALGVRAFFSS